MILTLVGSPNTGKSTFFNQLTGLSATVMNYPGSTVDLHHSKIGSIEIWDTPGIYSLKAQSEDERLTLKQIQRSDLLALVLDVTQLPRQIELLRQIHELGKPFIIILTMVDLLEKLNISFDVKRWSQITKVPTFYNSQFQLHLLEQSYASMVMEKNAIDFENLKNFVIQLQKPLVRGLSHWSLRWDQYVLHPVIGLITFVLIMFILFSSIFWFADPLVAGIEWGFATLARQVTEAPHFWGQEFLSQAVLPGISSFVVFVPQIFILFFLLNVLEGSGYLARAAFIADSVLLKIGLSGRAFVPLLSGFACAIPALMASRNLSSSKERAITRWIVPLLTCSARIPVFTLLVGTIFKSYGAGVKALGLMGLYVFSLIPAAISAKILNRFFDSIQHKQTPSLLALDMPWYRSPSIRLALVTSIQKSVLFVRRAGPTIFILSVGIYLLSTYPKSNDSEIVITESYLGQVAHFLEPVFKPMGLDGETGIAILAAFAAREVFVSTLAMIKSLEESDQVALCKVFNIPQALSLMFFFTVALQCLSTVALQAKESGSWKMALAQLGVFNLVAYLGAVLIYQIAHSLSF